MPEIDFESETNQLKEYWQARDDRIRQDRDIINLVKDVKRSDKTDWYSNEPKVFYDTAVALVSSYPPRFRLPLTINPDGEEKEKMNKAERFLIGVFRSLDDRQLRRGQTYWLRELAYWVLSGWYSVFGIVKQVDGEVKFIADLWDSLTVYPEWDSDGLTKVIRTYEVDKRTANAMASGFLRNGAKFEMPHIENYERPKVINYWMNDKGKIYNAILLGKTEVKPLTLEKTLDHIPVLCGAIGQPERDSADWTTRWGESIIAANRDMYGYENMMISLMSTIMTETAFPNLISKTQAGRPVTKEGMKGYGEEIALRQGETIELLKHASTPTEVNILLQWASSRKQKGSLPDIVYGGTPFEMSGFAISQLLAAIRYKLAPYINTMQYVMSQLSTDFMHQYRKGKFKKITLSTTNDKEIRKGVFFVEDFDKKDIPEVTYVSVTIPITSATDKTQQIIAAKQALSPPQLMSRETLWDEWLDIPDSEQEYARIIQDEMLEMPVVKQLALLQELEKRRDMYRNMGRLPEAQAIERQIQMVEMGLGMIKGAPQVGGQGMSPSTMPPEMMNNPDVARAAQGVPPPGLNRRPQTPQERAATEGGNQQVPF